MSSRPGQVTPASGGPSQQPANSKLRYLNLSTQALLRPLCSLPPVARRPGASRVRQDHSSPSTASQPHLCLSFWTAPWILTPPLSKPTRWGDATGPWVSGGDEGPGRPGVRTGSIRSWWLVTAQRTAASLQNLLRVSLILRDNQRYGLCLTVPRGWPLFSVGQVCG